MLIRVLIIVQRNLNDWHIQWVFFRSKADLAFELLGHLFLFDTAVNLLRFAVLVEVACNMECSADVTYGMLSIAIFAPESASPTTVGSPHCTIVTTTMTRGSSLSSSGKI